MQRRVCMGGARVWIISKRNEISDALFIHRARFSFVLFSYQTKPGIVDIPELKLSKEEGILEFSIFEFASRFILC